MDPLKLSGGERRGSVEVTVEQDVLFLDTC